MATVPLSNVVQHVRSMTAAEVSDRDLLVEYIAASDETAFAAIIRRHGRVVLGVCRRLLGPGPDADDAFQATLFVLARKAASILKQASLASWLHGVAHRVSSQLRAKRARQRQRETLIAGQIGETDQMRADPSSRASLREMGVILDEELQRLPHSCRDALVLCLMENVSHLDAATRLGCPLGTLKSRVQRGRELLRQRLEHRGIELTGIALTVLMAEQGRAAVSATLVQATLHGAAHNAVSPAVAALAKTVLATMSGQLKAMLAVIVLAGVTMAGVRVGAYGPSQEPAPIALRANPPTPLAQAKPEKKIERLDAFGDPLPEGAIARLGTTRLRPERGCNSIVFSPVSDFLVSGGYVGPIQFWDPKTGKELRRITGTGVSVLAISPNGKLLAGHGRDHAVHIWDTDTGKELRRLECNNMHGASQSLEFSPNGELLAACKDHLVVLWNVASGEEVMSRTWGPKVVSIAFAPHGGLLAVVNNNSEGGVWSTDSGNFAYELSGERFQLESLVFTRDGKYLLASGNSKCTVFDAATGKKLNTFSAGARNFALSPDGSLLATEGNSQDRIIRLWDWAAGKQVRTLVQRAHGGSLAFSRDGKTLASGGEGAIRLWDVASGEANGVVFGHDDRVTSVCYRATDQTIVTEAWDSTVRVWDSSTAKVLRTIPVPTANSQILFVGNLRGIQVTPDAKSVALVRKDNTLFVWNLMTGNELPNIEASAVAFSGDGLLMACAEKEIGQDSKHMSLIKLYDRKTGKEMRNFKGHMATISSLAFTPDGKTLLSCINPDPFLAMNRDEVPRESGMIRVWDVATGRERKVFTADQRLAGCFLSPDGRTLASPGGLQVKSIPLWETTTGALRGELPVSGSYYHDLAFSPDGRLIAFPCGDDCAIGLFDIFTGKTITHLVGHLNHVTTVDFSPDGTKLVSGSLDTTALIWDVGRFTQRNNAVELTATELESCWTDLSSDAQSAFRAIGKLVDSPKGAVVLLKELLKPAPHVDEQRIISLIANLGSNTFKTRETATKELEKLGDSAGGQMEKALAGKITLEMKQRIEHLLDKLEGSKLPPEMLRQIRAVEVLEFIATLAARELLESLVEGAPGARLTRESREAITRLAKAAN